MDVFTSSTMRQLGGVMNEHASTGPSKWAVAMLEKHGWKEGTGLGKEGTGMTSHVKVTKKADIEGIGFKETKQDNWANQWWFGTHAAVNGGGAAAPGASRIGGKAAVDIHSDSSSDSDSGRGKGKKGKKASSKKEKKASKKRGRADSDSSSLSDSDSGNSSSSLSDSDSDGKGARGGSGSPLGAGLFQAGVESTDALYQKLFQATGGARLGMRARRDQPGKWARAEAAMKAKAAKEAAEAEEKKKKEKKAEETAGGAGAAANAAEQPQEEEEKGDKKSKKDKKDKKEKAEKKEKKEKKEEGKKKSRKEAD